MKNNILAINEAIAKNNNLISEAAETKREATEKEYAIFDNLKNEYPNFKERIEARKNSKITIEYWENVIKEQNEKIDFLTKCNLALETELIEEAKTMIANNLLDNFSKIENVPARYKKVTKYTVLEELENAGIIARYSDFYNCLRIYNRNSNTSRETSLYFTKRNDFCGEHAADKEGLEKQSQHGAKTPQEIIEAVEIFVEVQKEIDKEKEEHAKRIAKLTEGKAVAGLSFK